MAKKPGPPRSAAANANAGETKRSAKVAPAMRAEQVEQLTNLVTVCISAAEDSVAKAIVARDATRTLAEALHSLDIITDAAFIQSPSLSPDMKDGLPGAPTADPEVPSADAAPAGADAAPLPSVDAATPVAPTADDSSSKLGGEFYAEINALPEGAALAAAEAARAAAAGVKPVAELVSAPAPKGQRRKRQYKLPKDPGVIRAPDSSRRPQGRRSQRRNLPPKPPAVRTSKPPLPANAQLIAELNEASTGTSSFYLMAKKYGVATRFLIDLAVGFRIPPYGAADGHFWQARIASRQNFAYRVSHNLSSRVANRIPLYMILSSAHQVIDYCYGGLIHSLGLRRKGLGEITYIVPDVLVAEIKRLDPTAFRMLRTAIKRKAARIHQGWSAKTLHDTLKIPAGCSEVFANVLYVYQCYRRSQGFDAVFLVLDDSATFEMIQALHDEPINSATLGSAPDYGEDKSTQFFMLNQDFLYALAPLLRLEDCTGPNSQNLARLINRPHLCPDLPVANIKLVHSR
jgi:hypothetical protein